MNSHLTTSGRWVFASAAAWLFTGAAAGEVAILWFGVLQVLVLAAAHGWVVLSGLALDRRFVGASVAPHDGEADARFVDEPVEIDVTFRNRSRQAIHGLRAQPYGAEELDWETPVELGRIESGAEVRQTVRLESDRAGRWALQGFDVAAVDPLGLVRVRDYVPCVRPFEFYPDVAQFRRDDSRDRRLSETEEREGQRQPAPLDSGVVIRELREYQPGDPLRHVAWKATARMRRLISREFDDEVTTSTTLMLDVSGSMRGGPEGRRKLDHAVDLVAGIADDLVATGNRVGLLTFDRKVYGHVSPGESRSHFRRILQHLIGLQSVVDPELTEWGDDELADFLADYLLVQERLDFRRDETDEVDRDLLDRWVQSRLPEERAVRGSGVLETGLLDGDVGPMREFARHRGLPIPYRGESRLGPKGRGLSAAFDRLATTGASRQVALVVSDLCGITNLDDLDGALGLAEYHGHTVRFLVPFTPAYYADREDRDEKRRILLELFSAAEREQRMENVAFLRSRGIDVQFVGPDSNEGSPMLEAG